MNTDYIPKSAEEKEEYWRSDALRVIALPPAEPLRTLAVQLRAGLAADDKKEVLAACLSMLKVLSAFYERVGLLYHHIQNTPVRPIVWKGNSNGTYQVDWSKTMANRPKINR